MKVFAMTIKTDFYVLAEDAHDALRIPEKLYPMSDWSGDLPTDAEPSVDVYEIRAQDDYHRRLCVNFE